MQITTFGPCRAIGVRYQGKNENGEIPALWGEFMQRWSEIEAPPVHAAFGVCRCLPGVTDGSFEYFAASAANAGAPVPSGMFALDIPQCEYAVFPVADLSETRQAWTAGVAALAAQDEWTGYCGEAGCDCATHPSFEYYPPEFQGSGPFYIYMPVKRK